MSQSDQSDIRPALWRLLKHPPAPGPWNMAVDEAILEAAGAGRVPPTLRLYAWEPACLSLGYAQPASDVDLARLHARGWDLVRRPTGGRAILHTDELTYSVTGPADDPILAGDILTSYRRLSAAILAAIQQLGLNVQALPKERASEDSPVEPVCFEVPSHYEITINGKKLVGSAQARRKEGVLQHGTLPLHGDLTRITQALNFRDELQRQEAAQRLLERATTIATALSQPITWEDAAAAFEKAFENVLNLRFQHSDLSPQEIARAETLLEERYANSTWVERKLPKE